MDPKSLRDLKMDVRLRSRPGWIASAEAAQAIESLPDVADKIATDEEKESAAASEAPARTAGAAPFSPASSGLAPSPEPEPAPAPPFGTPPGYTPDGGGNG